MAHEGSEGRQARQTEDNPLAEWIAAAVAAVLVAGSASVLGWHALHGEDGPAAPVLEVRGIRPQGGDWLVELQVRNAGRQAAADLQISGTLREGGEPVQRSVARLDLLPPGSSRRAALLFDRDPRGLELQLRAEGYQAP
ncbi:hypothetical protein [Ramlibacter rhizophilus]|uniref:TIGR02588 family protein n=1 Tax=Ramlibacter rhizophilus TaxID=1781167 RepID=A0A4Z0BNY5_9BURK|nr:hypothetical protein [Ramlibacter rhizophilus]TFZ01023.1 hypothetical protein EZ242_06405 [Ramlibacter rhizophilus]